MHKHSLQLMVKQSAIAPSLLADALDKIQAAHTSASVGLPSFLSTHPSDGDQRAKLESLKK